MTSQPLAIFLAVAILIVVWIPGQLLLASFLTLFAELAFIRWIAVEVWVFAYFKNLALLLCFVGFGLGCAMAGRKMQWKSALAAFLGLLLVVRLPGRGAELLEGISESLGGAKDLAIWSSGHTSGWAKYGTAALVAGALFLL